MKKQTPYNDPKLEIAVDSLISSLNRIKAELNPEKYDDLIRTLRETISSLNNTDDLIEVKAQIRNEIIKPVSQQLQKGSRLNIVFGIFAIIVGIVGMLLSYLALQPLTTKIGQIGPQIGKIHDENQKNRQALDNIEAKIKKMPNTIEGKKQKETISEDKIPKRQSPNTSDLSAPPLSSYPLGPGNLNITPYLATPPPFSKDPLIGSIFLRHYLTIFANRDLHESYLRDYLSKTYLSLMDLRITDIKIPNSLLIYNSKKAYPFTGTFFMSSPNEIQNINALILNNHGNILSLEEIIQNKDYSEYIKEIQKNYDNSLIASVGPDYILFINKEDTANLLETIQK